MAASLVFQRIIGACPAAGSATACGLAALTSVVPVDLAWSTSAFVVAASVFFLTRTSFGQKWVLCSPRDLVRVCVTFVFVRRFIIQPQKKKKFFAFLC